MTATSVARSLALVMALSMGAAVVPAMPVTRAATIAEQGVTTQDVLDAQKAWGKSLVRVGRIYTEGGDYRAAAHRLVETLYAYDLGPVLFKPTLASDVPFRGTLEAAVSYFVGGLYQEDHGFAIRPWTFVRLVNDGILVDGDRALAMGHYYFTDSEGAVTKVEYSFAYVRDSKGRLRITLHHSSLPYAPRDS